MVVWQLAATAAIGWVLAFLLGFEFLWPVGKTHQVRRTAAGAAKFATGVLLFFAAGGALVGVIFGLLAIWGLP